jgi:hypothetical protein
MTRRGRVKDLPQAEGCETPKAGRPKQGHKKPQKQMEKTAIQGGGRGKKKERKGIKLNFMCLGGNYFWWVFFAEIYKS